MSNNNPQNKNRNPQQGQSKPDPKTPNQKPDIDETQVPDKVNNPKAKASPRA